MRRNHFSNPIRCPSDAYRAGRDAYQILFQTLSLQRNSMWHRLHFDRTLRRLLDLKIRNQATGVFGLPASPRRESMHGSRSEMHATATKGL